MPRYKAEVRCLPRFKGCFGEDVEVVLIEAPNRRAARRKVRESHEAETHHIKRLELVRGARRFKCCCCKGVGGHFWQTYCYGTEQYDCGDEPCLTCAETGKRPTRKPCRRCRFQARWKAKPFPVVAEPVADLF